MLTGFWQGTTTESKHLAEKHFKKSTILKWILKKQDGWARNGLVRFSIG